MTSFLLFFGVFFCFFYFVDAKLACEYLTMQNGNIVVANGTRMCLGPCPNTMGPNGIYIASGQTIYFSNFFMTTSTTGMTLKRSDGTPVLVCTLISCFASTVPLNVDELDAGFYLTGRPGASPLGLNDPWQASSTVLLSDQSILQQVNLQGHASISGWRLAIGNMSYAFTNRNQLVVGFVPVPTILGNPGAMVLAEGPVLVRGGQKGCPYPLPRPAIASVTLIYATNNWPDGNLSLDASAFVYTVPINTCNASPIGINGPFQGTFFKVLIDERTILFFGESLCSGSISFASLGNPGTSGWSAIYLPISALQNMV